MQRTDGVRRILSSATGYSLFQDLAGAGKLRRWLSTHFWRIPPESKVVDVGCGTGDVLSFLPDAVTYLGFDPSEPYIREASRRFANRTRTTFLHGVAPDFRNDPRFKDTDVVLCNGVLHHLDEREASGLLGFARHILRDGGRFLGTEPCYLMHQSRLSRWIMRLDRGANIRYEEEWKQLVSGVFPRYSSGITTNLIRLPYVHILLKGTKGGGSEGLSGQLPSP